jgi:DNA-binding transcriptional LysR family regulator
MELDMLNIRQLECFRAIMTTGNMTQAAEMLGIAQPSASSLIANLEHSLGFELFERSKGRLIATPEARALLPDVILSLETVELTKHRARQIKEDRRGDLSIVSYPDIAIDFLPSLLSQFLSTRPGVRVNLQARRTEMMSGLLPTHDYDLAITTRLAETRALHVQEFQIPCVAVYPKGYAPSIPTRSRSPTFRAAKWLRSYLPTQRQFSCRNGFLRQAKCILISLWRRKPSSPFAVLYGGAQESALSMQQQHRVMWTKWMYDHSNQQSGTTYICYVLLTDHPQGYFRNLKKWFRTN